MADSQHTTTTDLQSKAPAFQFYPKDYLSDAKTRAMTFKQRGMYWDLVSHCWLEGGLPADPKEIARILGVSTSARFEKNDWPVIGKCFRLIDGGHQHPRLELERRKQSEHREERSEAGKRGADKRWHSHGSAIKEPMAKNASSSPISDLRTSSPSTYHPGSLKAVR